MADPDASLTPEKRLLKLIEGASPRAPADKPAPAKPQPAAAAAPSKPKAAPAPAPAAAVDPVKFVSGFADRLIKYKDSWKNFGKQPAGELNFKQLNGLFKVLTALAGVYLMAVLIGEIATGDRKFLEVIQQSEQEIAELPAAAAKKFDVSAFESGPKADIFVPPSRRQTKTTQEAEQASAQLVEMIKDFKLVGVSINPADVARTYCMIEDLKKEMTSFLKVGDSLSGLKIMKIEPETVVLTRGKEQIELR